jgi:molybdopterin converting factor small subunit
MASPRTPSSRNSGYTDLVEVEDLVIDVQLFAYLAKYSPTGQETFKLELDSTATVGLLFSQLKISQDVERVVLVNGRQAKDSTRLKDGDDVFVFPPMVGG